MMVPTGTLLDELSRHFRPRSRPEMVRAVHELAAAGFSERDVAAVTDLSTEMVRRMLAERVRPPQ